MLPRVIFIDWDGTLSNSRFWGHWAVNPDLAPHYTAIQRVFFESAPENIENWMRGRLSAEMVARFITTKTGLPMPIVLSGLYRSCEQMTLLDPEVLADIAIVRKHGVKVVLATDNMDAFVRWTVPALRLNRHFDAILDSHTLRALKKDIDHTGRSPFFSSYLEQTQTSANQAVLIDDSVHNRIVSNIGMRYEQVTPDNTVRQILRQLYA